MDHATKALDENRRSKRRRTRCECSQYSIMTASLALMISLPYDAAVQCTAKRKPR